MAGLEPNIIYVDLGGVDVNGPKETNGAPLCGVASVVLGGPPVGTENYPLSFEEFRLHVQYRLTDNISGKIRTYMIKGSYTGTVDYGAGGFNTGIFNINYVPTSNTDSYTVQFQNWDEDEPFKMSISAESSSDLIGAYNPSLYFLNTSGVIVNIIGMELGAGTFTDVNETKDIGNIVFSNSTDSDIIAHKYRDKLILNNCRLYTTGNGEIRYDPYMLDYTSAYWIMNYATVGLYNCLFYTENKSDIMFTDYPVNNSNAGSWDLYYDICNTLFLNVDDVLRMENGQSMNVTYPNFIDGNVFSEANSNYMGVATWSVRKVINLLADGKYQDCQFGFTVPALTYNTSLTQNDYLYNDNGWENITVVGNRLDINNPNTWGVRDGVGALYFPEILPPNITLSPAVVTVGDTTTLGINDYTTYDTTYQPSLYEWYKGDELTPFESGGVGIAHDVPLLITEKGIIPISITVTSYNSWYTVSNNTNIRSLIDQDEISLSLLTNNSDGVDSTSFKVNDSINIVVNVSPSTDVKIKYVYINDTWVSLDTTYSTTYKYIGNQNIIAKVEFTDGSTMYTAKTISITDGVYDTYYVDLSSEYEDNLLYNLKYVIYDDFEDQNIDNAFKTLFRFHYGVKYMYDEYVASYDSGMSDITIASGILNGNFNVEWSFVRNTVDSIPKMKVFIDDVGYTIKWDYITNSLVLMKNNSIIKTISYGKYSKDLTCSNALHKLYCKLKMDNGVFNLMYSVDGITYKAIEIAQIPSFVMSYVNVDTDSHSGYGYILIEADNVNTELFGDEYSLVKGSEEYPLTYTDMKSRIVYNGSGAYGDIYKCKNWRQIRSDLICDADKEFHIDVWNPLKYGPWMMRFYRCNASFNGVTLSNGIMYSVLALGVTKTLTLTTTYNMFITWNGTTTTSKIILSKNTNRYTGKDKRVDIIGSTIKSQAGFITGG